MFVCDTEFAPCLNGGTCSRGEGDNFVCSCPEGYQGTLCDCVDGKSRETNRYTYVNKTNVN